LRKIAIQKSAGSLLFTNPYFIKIFRTSKDFFFSSIKEYKSNVIDKTPLSASTSSIALKIVLFLRKNRHNSSEINFLQPLKSFRIILHSPYELPSYSSRQFFHNYRQHIDVKLYPQVFLLDDDLKSFSPSMRNCFLDNEHSLKYFKVYTRKNCEQECLSDLVDATCGCVPFYVISE
jgi:hypothetical protein